ncbi:MAG: hypothetical protein WCX97_00895 [Candidatus Magasanikbacteria bacterium]
MNDKNLTEKGQDMLQIAYLTTTRRNPWPGSWRGSKPMGGRYLFDPPSPKRSPPVKSNNGGTTNFEGEE